MNGRKKTQKVREGEEEDEIQNKDTEWKNQRQVLWESKMEEESDEKWKKEDGRKNS